MPVDDEIVNPSDNRPFADVLEARISRRSVMVGSLAAAATTFLATSGPGRASSPDPFTRAAALSPHVANCSDAVRFTTDPVGPR